MLILDATELTRDWMLSGFEFQLIGFLTDLSKIRAAVPESVIIEVVANHTRALQALIVSAQRTERLFSRLGVDAGLHTSTLVEGEYENHLRGRLEALGIETLPWPRITHKELTERATSRRPPFDEKGSGYRDSLVWASVVEAASTGNDIILASQDQIFSDGKGNLSEALKTETDPASVQLVRQLGKWLALTQPWPETDLREAAGRARDALFLNYFAPWDMFEDPGFSAQDMGLTPDASISDVSYFASGDLVTTDSRGMGPNSSQITYTFFADFEITLTVDQASADGYSSSWEPTRVLDRVEVSVVIRMDARMIVDFDPRKDNGEDWPYDIVSVEWTPRQALDFSARPFDPGPNQPSFDFADQLQRMIRPDSLKSISDET